MLSTLCQVKQIVNELRCGVLDERAKSNFRVIFDNTGRIAHPGPSRPTPSQFRSLRTH